MGVPNGRKQMTTADLEDTWAQLPCTTACAAEEVFHQHTKTKRVQHTFFFKCLWTKKKDAGLLRITLEGGSVTQCAAFMLSAAVDDAAVCAVCVAGARALTLTDAPFRHGDPLLPGGRRGCRDVR